MVVYFPAYFPKNGNKEYTALRYKRMNILLDAVIDQKEAESKDLFIVEKEILEHDKPNVWNVWKDENMERTLEVDFQKFGIAVTERSGQKLSETTTFEFYATVEHLKEKHKK